METLSGMRRVLLLIFASGMLLLSACSKDEKKEQPANSSAVTAKITFEDGKVVDFNGSVLAAAWAMEDGDNILTIMATDKNFKNAMLTFGISYADGPGTYSLEPNELMANPATLLWTGMEYDNWPGFVTGDANGDGKDDGTGTFTITTLNEKRTKGTFSMVMGNDIGEKLTVEGKFDCKVMRLIEE